MKYYAMNQSQGFCQCYDIQRLQTLSFSEMTSDIDKSEQNFPQQPATSAERT